MTREEAILILNISLDCDKGKSKMFMIPMQQYITAQEMAIEALKEKRPHGEWIDKGEYAECSICGGCSGTQFDGVEPIALKTNFCPNCGASMILSNSEIEKSKSEIVPDYRDGWRLREGDEK